MRGYFTQILLGLLLVVLDFTINGFDILPDLFGYLMIGVAASSLTSLSPQFASASKVAFVCAVICLIGFMIPFDVRTLYTFVATLINCVLIWRILGGIADFSTSLGRHDFVARANNRRMAYVVITLGSMIGMAIAGNSIAAVGVCVMAAIVAMCLVLHLLHRTRVELLPAAGYA